MNMCYDDGGSAFPWPPVGTGDPRDGMAGGSSGMSLRDYFDGIDLLHCRPEEAYKLADAMLAERAKRNGGAS